MTRVVGDFYRTWDIFAVAGSCSFVLLLVYLFLARFNLLSGFVTGIFSFIAIILFTALIYLVYIDGYRIDDRTCADFGAVEMVDCDSDMNPYRIISYVMIGLLFVISVGISFILPILPKINPVLQISLSSLKQYPGSLIFVIVLAALGAPVYI
jgi:hypothetical protein